MSFHVLLLRRAEKDLRHIARWLSRNSPQGALAWLESFERAVSRLEADADALANALEYDGQGIRLRQILFGTKCGSTYRAIFTIAGNQVRVLRIRGPGQPPIEPDELP